MALYTIKTCYTYEFDLICKVVEWSILTGYFSRTMI